MNRPQWKRNSSGMHMRMPRLGSITEMKEVGQKSPIPNVKFDYFSYEESSLEKSRATIEVIKKEVKVPPKASTKSGLCDICFEQATQPRRTRCCGDIFCAEHLADWVESRSRCPTCEKPLSLDEDSISLVPTPKFTLSPTKLKGKNKLKRKTSREVSLKEWRLTPTSTRSNSTASLASTGSLASATSERTPSPSPPPPYTESSDASKSAPSLLVHPAPPEVVPVPHYAANLAARARLSEDIGNALMLVGALLTTVTLILIVLDLGESYGAPHS